MSVEHLTEIVMPQNKKIILLLLATMTMLVNAVAQKPSAKLEDPEWIRAIASKRIVYTVPLMKRVRVRKNLIYKQIDGVDLKFDVYSRVSAHRGRRPVVIFIHGGRIPPNLLTTPKEWGAYVSFGQLVAASGFVGVTFNHRFYAWESLANSQSDLMDLIAYVRAHADEFGVDSNRIVLWAVSAGGIFLSQPLRDRPPYIKCLVAYYAELDLRNERPSAPASVSDETLRDFSPAYYLSKGSRGIPPIFIARAGLDETTLNAGLDRFVQLALSSNLTLDLANHATGHHGFDVEDDDERSREIIKRTIEFIKLHS